MHKEKMVMDMYQRFEEIVRWMLQARASDLHITITDSIYMECRVSKELVSLDVKDEDNKLITYLGYLANMQLSNEFVPQSGAFRFDVDGRTYGFRFAILKSDTHVSAVLRILNYRYPIPLNRLVLKGEHRTKLKQWCQSESGLILISGPTGSGKTTTLYSLLDYMKQRKIYTLEDPIELQQEHLVQIAINPQIGMSYDQGIRQLMRHDPDVVVIGEIRDEQCAKMVVRCALTGHLVISTIHAKSCKGTISRMIDLGVSESDLVEVLVGIANQRLYPLKQYPCKISIYELYDKYAIEQSLHGQKVLCCMEQEVEYACKKNWIDK